MYNYLLRKNGKENYQRRCSTKTAYFLKVCWFFKKVKIWGSKESKNEILSFYQNHIKGSGRESILWELEAWEKRPSNAWPPTWTALANKFLHKEMLLFYIMVGNDTSDLKTTVIKKNWDEMQEVKPTHKFEVYENGGFVKRTLTYRNQTGYFDWKET